MGSPEAAYVVDVLKRWERAADDLLYSVDDLSKAVLSAAVQLEIHSEML